MKQTTKESIDKYKHYGLPPGHFLEAVLSNDLSGALFHADVDNASELREIVRYINDTMPVGARGCSGSVRGWIKASGLQGLTMGVSA